MNANSTKSTARPSDTHTRRLLARMNPTLFHCLGAALLLQSAAVAAGERCGGDAATTSEHRERTHRLHEYAASVWPEFAWDSAFAAIRCLPGAMFAAGDSQAVVAAFAQQAAALYRAASRIADDAALRSALAAMGSAEPLHAACRPGTRVALMRWLAGLTGRRDAKDCRARMTRRAYEVLQQHWLDSPPFAAIAHDGFVARVDKLLADSGGLSKQQRWACRGWRPRIAIRTQRTAGARSGACAAALRPACALPPAAVLR